MTASSASSGRASGCAVWGPEGRRARRPTISWGVCRSAAALLLLAATTWGCRSTIPRGVAGSAATAGVGVTFLGKVSWGNDVRFADTEVGGLSSLTYDRERRVYYALSDDRGERQPMRFYTLEFALGDRSLDADDVRLAGVTLLRDASGSPYAPRTVDPEGMVLAAGDRLFLSSEGSATAGVAPFVRELGRDGRERRELALPRYLLPAAEGTVGVRDNLALEALAVTPDGRWLFVGSENALAQDGPVAAPGVPSPSRLLRYDLARDRWDGEFLYWTEPVMGRPSAGGAATNGLVELIALDERRLLSLERSYAEGWGLSIRLFLLDLGTAEDVTGRPALAGIATSIRPVGKRLIAHLERFAGTLDNVEGMTFGPPLADGRRLLLLVADNNFSPTQQTQFVALALSGLP
jgi:hypothetical protein